MPGPILYCHDGSTGSGDAMRTAGALISKTRGYDLTPCAPIRVGLSS
jgi:hypothetical protein